MTGAFYRQYPAPFTGFAYEELTWPEVDRLPRDTPLVIPLGEGYDLDRLPVPLTGADSLGQPLQMGLLPSIPYGWPGSGVVIPEAVFGKFVANLLDSLREDGFSQVFALTPQGLELDLGSSAKQVSPISIAHSSQNNRFCPANIDAHRDKVILIPIGHTEQHAYHLPFSTDTLIIEAISQGAASAAPDLAFSLPVMPYGVSMHRSSFAGTLNAGGRAFEDFYVAVIDALAECGFDRMYLLSGHGGNSSFLVNVVKYSGERHRRIFCATAFLYLSSPQGVEILEKHRRSEIGGMGHACELETSLILHLRPDLVHMERVVDELDFVATPSYYMDWAEGGALVANPPWDDDTITGAYGAGSLATPAKGKIWLEAAIAEKVIHIREIHEQHQRREERRRSGYGEWGGKSLRPGS